MIDTMPARLSWAINSPHEKRGGADLDEMKKLIAAEPDLVNQMDPWDKYPLTHAARNGEIAAMQLLLAAGAKVNAAGEFQQTALHAVAGDEYAKKRIEVVKLLLAGGADVHARNWLEQIPLHEAVKGKTKVDLDIVKLLIAAGSDVNAANRGGGTVLMTACDRSSPAIVQALIDAGANVNAVTRQGTALAVAAENNRADIAAVLLENGADAAFRFAADFKSCATINFAGKTALDVAREKKARKVIPLLEAAAAGRRPAPLATGKAVAPGKSWRKIKKWLKANKSGLHKALHPPASAEQLAYLEGVIGAALPDDFKEAWKIHNGHEDGDNIIAALDGAEAGSYFLMSCEQIVQEWQSWKGLIDSGEFADQLSGPDKGIRDAWWHPGWIPFASNGGGDSLCLDLAPTADGAVGQVISMNHESAERQLLAPSFAHWLAALAESIETGEE